MNPRRHVTRSVAFVLLASPFALGMLPDSAGLRTAISAEPSDVSRHADSDKLIDRWIGELNSDTYAVRERAAAALIRNGLAAKPALEDAAQYADLETQLQAERILAIVVENGLDKRIAAFENDIDGSGGITLPGWNRAATRVGDGIERRKLFAEMYRAESALLNEYERHPELAAGAFEKRVRAIREGLTSLHSGPIHYRLNRSHPSLRSSVRALLLVGSDPKVSISDGAVVQFDQLLQQTWSSRNSLATKSIAGDTCLSDWIAIRSTTDTLELQHLHLGMVFGIESTIDIAERVLRRPTTDSNHQRIAVLCIARFGDESHIPLLESLLENDARVAYDQRVINKRKVRVETQMRDIALAALVHITNQDENDFKLITKVITEPYEFRPSAIFFKNAADRAKAMERWAAWRGEHQDKPSDMISD